MVEGREALGDYFGFNRVQILYNDREMVQRHPLWKILALALSRLVNSKILVCGADMDRIAAIAGRARPADVPIKQVD